MLISLTLYGHNSDFNRLVLTYLDTPVYPIFSSKNCTISGSLLKHFCVTLQLTLRFCISSLSDFFYYVWPRTTSATIFSSNPLGQDFRPISRSCMVQICSAK